MKKMILMSLVAFAIVGCGADGESNSASDQRGDTTVTTITTEGDVEVKNVTVTDEGVYVDCGVGGCGDIVMDNEGDIVIGDRVAPSEAFDLDGDGQDDDGTCPEGYFFCPIEGKCVPGQSDVPCGG